METNTVKTGNTKKRKISEASLQGNKSRKSNGGTDICVRSIEELKDREGHEGCVLTVEDEVEEVEMDLVGGRHSQRQGQDSDIRGGEHCGSEGEGEQEEGEQEEEDDADYDTYSLSESRGGSLSSDAHGQTDTPTGLSLKEQEVSEMVLLSQSVST